MSDLFNDLMESVDAALDASEQLQQYTNYGKLDVGVEYLQWVNKQPVEIGAKEYRDLPAGQKQMNVVVRVDIQEFKPELDFGYERKVKFCGADWYDILQPSIVDVFDLEGKSRDLTKEAAKAFFNASGKYVFVNDVPNKKGRTYNGKVLKVPALTHVFESRDDMLDAVVKRFGSLPDSVATNATPSASNSYSEEVAGAVKVLAKSGMDAAAIASSVDEVSESDVKKILGDM